MPGKLRWAGSLRGHQGKEDVKELTWRPGWKENQAISCSSLVQSVQQNSFLLLLLFIYCWERETEHELERGREKETQNLKQDPGSELSGQSPTWGSNSWTARSWLEPKWDAQPPEPLRRPNKTVLNNSNLSLFSNRLEVTYFSCIVLLTQPLRGKILV